MRHHVVTRILGLAAAVLCALSSGPARSGNPDAPPNVVLILADDLGWTDLGVQGSKYYETPNIDRLAAEGMRFTQGYSCGPNCQPTRAALMSGQYGPRTGVYTVGDIDRFAWRTRPLRPVDNVTRLPLEKQTIAEVLQRAGYATAMYGKWHLGDQGRHHPARRGFDEAIVSMGKHFEFNTIPKTPYPRDQYLADFLTERGEQFIRKNRDRPFFLYLSHFAVHNPLEAKDELTEHFRRKPPVGGHHDPVYAAMIASLDDSVGRITALLKELNLERRTLLIFSSDNGGVGGYEREGVVKASDVTDNAPLRGGKGMLYEGGIRVPWIFRWPGTVPARTVSHEPIISVDLFPTLVALTGAYPPPSYPLDGENLVPLISGKSRGPLSRDALFWHFPGYLGGRQDTWRTTPTGAIRAGDWKLLERFEDGRLELYNLKKDPGETRDLAVAEPRRAQELQRRLAAWREALQAKMPKPNTPEPRNGERGREQERRQDPDRA